MESDKTIKSLGDAQLILDARKILQTWPVGEQQNRKTVATGVFFDAQKNEFKRVYSVSSNKTSESSRLKAAELGYERISGSKYRKPGKTHAEQILINYAEDENLLRSDVDAPIAPSRSACGANGQNCSGTIESTPGVRLIGPSK
jgi:hypothetical protein